MNVILWNPDRAIKFTIASSSLRRWHDGATVRQCDAAMARWRDNAMPRWCDVVMAMKRCSVDVALSGFNTILFSGPENSPVGNHTSMNLGIN